MSKSRVNVKPNRTLKILIVGDSTVGKTAFMHRYVNGVFLDDYKTTLGVDFFQRTIEWECQNEQLLLNLQVCFVSCVILSSIQHFGFV